MFVTKSKMRDLPIELVWHILGYMRYRERTQLITRDWLQKQMRRRVRLRKWYCKVRMNSYIKVFGQSFCNRSWSKFCKETLDINRRSRNVHYRLTWKAAAEKIFRKRCKGCGKETNSLVFGLPLCLQCRRNPHLPECFMVSVTEAKARGIPKRILDTIPWHGSTMGCRLRFWTDIEAKLL